MPDLEGEALKKMLRKELLDRVESVAEDLAQCLAIALEHNESELADRLRSAQHALAGVKPRR